MARGRLIEKSLSTSEKFNALSQDPDGLGEFCQALFVLLIIHSDDFGRLQGDPSTVKFICHPGSSRNLPEFHGALWKLQEAGLVHWYTVEGKQYLQIIDFEAHQGNLHKRTRTKFPEFPGVLGTSEKFPVNRIEYKTSTDQNAVVSDQLNGKDLLLPSVAAGVADATRPAAATVANPYNASNPKATNGERPSLLVGERVEASRKHKPVFMGARFSVFEWQLRELEATIGDERFDVLEFLFELDARHTQSGQILPRDKVWPWLQAQIVGEARRRGLSVVATPADLSPLTTRMMDAVARFTAEDES